MSKSLITMLKKIDYKVKHYQIEIFVTAMREGGEGVDKNIYFQQLYFNSDFKVSRKSDNFSNNAIYQIIL